MAKERDAKRPWSWQQPSGLRAWDKDRVGLMARRAGVRDQALLGGGSGLGTAENRPH